jgi:hypothetical protein
MTAVDESAWGVATKALRKWLAPLWRRQRRFDMSPMSADWLLRYESEARKHREQL